MNLTHIFGGMKLANKTTILFWYLNLFKKSWVLQRIFYRSKLTDEYLKSPKLLKEMQDAHNTNYRYIIYLSLPTYLQVKLIHNYKLYCL